MPKIKFFVYGTLKKGGFFSNKFDSKRTSVKKATAMGTMFSVGGNFPAAVFDGKSQISGEIHEYDDEVAILNKFDSIEGYISKKHKSNLYNRKNIIVVTENGDSISCTTYEFNRETADLKKVESGVWEI